jgi:Fic family protein
MLLKKNLETGEEKIWFRTTPPGPQTDVAMQNITAVFQELFTSNEYPKLVLIAVFIVHFLAIHPFRDGNGRLSRLMTTWLLLKANYSWQQYVSHEKFIENNKEQYYITLRETQRTIGTSKIDYNHWVEFFLTIIYQQCQFLITTIEGDSPISELNQKETAVYNLIKANKRCTISFIEKELKFNRNGLKALLRRMVQRESIKKSGKKKGTKYHL